MKPKKVNILGVEYKVIYCDKPSDVDHMGRESLWGGMDPWTRIIRIYDNGRPDEDIWQTIIHEVLHAIDDSLHLNIDKEDKGDERLDMLALALTDVLFRNKWIRNE